MWGFTTPLVSTLCLALMRIKSRRVLVDKVIRVGELMRHLKSKISKISSRSRPSLGGLSGCSRSQLKSLRIQKTFTIGTRGLQQVGDLSPPLGLQKWRWSVNTSERWPGSANFKFHCYTFSANAVNFKMFHSLKMMPFRIYIITPPPCKFLSLRSRWKPCIVNWLFGRVLSSFVSVIVNKSNKNDDNHVWISANWNPARPLALMWAIL